MSSARVAGGGLYCRCFANPRHDGFVAADWSGLGKVGFRLALRDERGAPILVRSVLTDETGIVIDGVSCVIGITPDGEESWRRSKAYGTPVVLDSGRIYIVSAKRRDRYEVLHRDGTPLAVDEAILGIVDESWITLFEPYEKSIVVQIQDRGVAQVSPQAVLMYRLLSGDRRFVWSVEFSGAECPLLPLAFAAKGRLVSGTHEEAVVLDLDAPRRTPEPLARFPLPLGRETRWVSAMDDGTLLWAGSRDGFVAIVATDLAGRELWRWPARVTESEPGVPVCPPIVAGQQVTLLSTSGATALVGGVERFTSRPERGRIASATALRDGSLVIAGGDQLWVIDPDGRPLAEVAIGETSTTAPAPDGRGALVVGTRGAIHAIV